MHLSFCTHFSTSPTISAAYTTYTSVPFILLAIIASKLTDKYVTLIMPARWFAAGRENLLGDFRTEMLKGEHLRKLVVFPDGGDVFQNVEIKGGICYYLEDNQYSGLCQYVLYRDGLAQCSMRKLDTFDILIREPQLYDIVVKVEEKRKTDNMDVVETIISADTPFGIPSTPRTSTKTPFKVYTDKTNAHNVLLSHIEDQKRKIEYVSQEDIHKNAKDVEKYKVFIPGAGGSGNDAKVLGTPIVAPKNSVCSQSFLYAAFETEEEASNFMKYLLTKFFRILVSSLKITQSAPSRVYRFVPLQDFTDKSDIDWSQNIADIDRQLYTKYSLSPDEIAFIEKTIRPME